MIIATINSALLALLIFLQVLDVLSTMRVIKAGVGHEGNPFLALLMNPFDIPGIKRILDRFRPLPPGFEALMMQWPWLILILVKTLWLALIAATWTTAHTSLITTSALLAVDLFYAWVVNHNRRLLH